MKLSDLHQHLQELSDVHFELPTGEMVPAHFHITEAGFVQKKFIDCGGTLRNEERINLQLWSSIDLNHRLTADKFRDILNLSTEKLNLPDVEIEVEYQGQTIEKYGLSFKEGLFQLEGKKTDCLAQDNCGIPSAKVKRSLAQIGSTQKACTPGGNCC